MKIISRVKESHIRASHNKTARGLLGMDLEILNHGQVKYCGSPMVKVSDHGRHVMSSSPVPLKTRRVGQRCTLNLSRAETSSRWCGVVVRRGVASSGVVHVT
ncbi:uncharacterized protein TNCV_3229411 [Trichonephila clavipes]|nr:uncharacterized protein TNCV_3229411 [Trichonephila clavipes]